MAGQGRKAVCLIAKLHWRQRALAANATCRNKRYDSGSIAVRLA
jgi:hypothetical protein